MLHGKKGISVTAVSPQSKTVSLSNGEKESYDKLLIASGASTFIPPVPGMKKPDGTVSDGVYELRSLDDAVKIKQAAQKAKRIVILGAGLVGIDAASSLSALGKTAVLVEARSHILPVQLDRRSAQVYQDAFAERGGEQHYNVSVSEVRLDDRGSVCGVILSTGLHISCDMIICATGVRANTAFLSGSGIICDEKGLVFNERGMTNISGIYGAGDVSGRSPIWPLAVKQGIIAGTNMAGGSTAQTDFFASKSTLVFWGIRTMSLGNVSEPDSAHKVEVYDKDGSYRKIVHSNGIIHGAIVQGDLSYAGILSRLIAENIDVSRVKKPVFEIDYSDFFSLKENFEFVYK